MLARRLAQPLLRPLMRPVLGVQGLQRSFAQTVASWYDTGAPGRFVPTYKDWATSGALWIDSNTRASALEQAIWLNLDRSQNLKRGPELIVNGDFSSSVGWTVGGAGAAITGGQGVLTAASTGSGFSQGGAVANRVYEVTFTLVSLSSGGVRAYAGSGGFGPLRTTPGTYTEKLVASGTTLFSVTAIGTTTAAVDDLSVKEIPGAHRVQTTSTSRAILTARKNQFTETEFRNGLADAPVRNGIVAASGLSWPNGITTGVEFPVPQTSTTWAYKSVIPMAASAQYSVAAFVRMSDGNAPVFPSPGTPQAGANDFAMVIGGAAYSPTILADLGAGVFLVGAVGVSPSTPTSASGIARYGTTQIRSMIASGFQIVPGSVAGRYQRVNTATDYDSVGFPVGLRYDGIDDRDATVGSVNFSAANRIGYAWAGRKEGTSRSTAMILSNSSNVPAGSVGLETTFSTAGTYRYGMNPAGAANVPYALVSGYAEPSTNVVSCLNDRTTTVIANAIQARVDGAPRPGQTTYSSEANLTTAAFLNAPISFGANGGGGQYLTGVEYGDFWLGDCTLDQLAIVEKGFAPLLSEALA